MSYAYACASESPNVPLHRRETGKRCAARLSVRCKRWLAIVTQTTHGYSIYRTSSSRRHVVSKSMPARSADSLNSLASSANASSIDGKSV